VVQPVDRAVCAAGALVIDQGLDVGGIQDRIGKGAGESVSTVESLAIASPGG
jgi:hypothetical protein